MSAVAETLGVARSNLAERKKGATKPRGRYRKAEDADLAPLIRAIVDARPTYGYRRVCALANRQLRTEGKPPVNVKRVLRIMQNNGLTLERHTARRPGRTHDGVVIVLRSNCRWCSDHLEIRARNGEVVRVLFVIDACDREIIAWSAVANGGVSGEMVRDLMIAAVERRFGALKVLHRVEWLSDNGSAYIAADTADTARALSALSSVARYSRAARHASSLFASAFQSLLATERCLLASAAIRLASTAKPLALTRPSAMQR